MHGGGHRGGAGYPATVWENAASASGVLTLLSGVTPDGKRRAEGFFAERMAGSSNAKRVLFADKDSTFTPISISPEDSEVPDSVSSELLRSAEYSGF